MRKIGLHITDCGLDTASGRGGDTRTRIESLYHHLGVTPLLNRETSAIGVAFTAATTAESVLRLTGQPHQVIAFNRAPRTQYAGKEQAGGGRLLHLGGRDGTEYIGYGEEVLNWLHYFQGEVESTVSVDRWPQQQIEDTTSGTQFRSLEHLVPIHADLLADPTAVVGEHSTCFRPDTVEITDNEAVVLPSDEFGNGRLLLRQRTFSDALAATTVSVEGFTDHVTVAASLTEAEGLSLWPSSNRLPNSELIVANLGRKWETDHEGNDVQVSQLGPEQRIKLA